MPTSRGEGRCPRNMSMYASGNVCAAPRRSHSRLRLIAERRRLQRPVARKWAPRSSSALIAALLFRRLIGSFAVDQPRYPEPIDEHAKTLGPERLLERHRNPTILAQLVKDALGLGRALDLER